MSSKFFSIIRFLIFFTIMVFIFLPEQMMDLIFDHSVNYEELLQEIASPKLYFILFVFLIIFINILKEKDDHPNDNDWKEMLKYFSKNYHPLKKLSFKFGSGYIGYETNFNFLLICADTVGLYIKHIFPFNLTLKPILIPWSEISLIKTEKKKPPFLQIPSFINNKSGISAQTKYVKINLNKFPEQEIVIQWEDDFDSFVPSSLKVKK
ncbi:MAG: hypothetical protein OEY96_04785 [Gammaproteobacteria bacterium]|nr:hypothetical protein [Gammaproteobacteria bacterium]